MTDETRLYGFAGPVLLFGHDMAHAPLNSLFVWAQRGIARLSTPREWIHTRLAKAHMDIPVILFAYARPNHLRCVLECLRRDAVPQIIAYADAAKGEADASSVAEVRTILRAIDWARVELTERTQNLGLGLNILSGVSEVAARHKAFIVWEDDLICVPGTYAWLCAVLRTYANDERVMSVTGWTHPRVTPRDVGEGPYFDGRAECWVWGTWARAWQGMAEETALTKMAAAMKRGIPANAYGSDLPDMARAEEQRNIWAVRWLYHHLQHGGLCARPPWSMVEHIGWGTEATNAGAATAWANPTLRPIPPPAIWPIPIEHPRCQAIWRSANPGRLQQRILKLCSAQSLAKHFLPTPLRHGLRRAFGHKWFSGHYTLWSDARAKTQGYEEQSVLTRVLAATREVVAGYALWERDGATFTTVEINVPLVTVLRRIASIENGRLDLIDFGGALGSTWRQHRIALEEIPTIRWRVVEQPHYVEAGKEFENTTLSFNPSLQAALEVGTVSTVLLSSVLPYIESPQELLETIVRAGVRHVIIDRTSFATDGRQRITVQHVPKNLGGGSYPCWLFNRETLLAPLSKEYQIASEWPGFDDIDHAAIYRGFWFERKI